MRISSVVLTLCLVSCFAPIAGSQTSKPESTKPADSKPADAKPGDAKPADSKPADAKPDYSKEPFVDEEDSTKIVFENDGTGTRESSVRVRIQSDSGLKRFGVLTFPYQGAVENVEIDYIRVHKPDGTVVTTPAENIQDMPSEITRQAPFYSDLREKQVAVKGLSVSDVLEWHTRSALTKPLAPGQFWTAFNFPHDSIILHEEVQVSVPRERTVQWKSHDSKPVITEVGKRRLFTWTTSQLQHPSPEQQEKEQEENVYLAARGKLPPPQVQLSSFQSWEEVGAWYNKLQRERISPSPEVRAKAAELTKAATDENSKMHAIYDYVSTQFRYIGIAFGIGRYQPHSAAEVMANQYGDCKDKHTLLASLFDAVGIRAYAALINSSHEIDADVPSPGQFDHVVTAVPKGTDFIWLDSTAEVAPFAYLLSALRDKSALVIAGDKPATLVTSATDPAIPALRTFRIDAKLSAAGTLEGKVEHSVAGDDSEVVLRSAFRRVPMPQWKDLIQQISYGSGFGGDVSEVTASSPEKINEPLHWNYKYTRKEYSDWSNRRITPPLPPILLPDPETKPSHPVWLGSARDMDLESAVELPKGYRPLLPAKVDLKENFGEYHARYSVKNGVLKADRKLLVRVREVSLSDYDAYKKFVKSINNDQNFYIALSENGGVTPFSYMDAVWELPYSDNPEAARAYDEAKDGYQRHDTAGEIASLKHAVELDPKFTRAWLWMADIYKYERQMDLALQAYHSAITNDPQQPLSYKALAFTLMTMKKPDDAIPVWRQVISLEPDDPDNFSNLAATFFLSKRYSEASAALESAVKLAPDNPDLHLRLGSSYVRAGDEAKGVAELKKGLELDPKPVWFNNAAYALAEANKQLPLALQYAEKAVREEEEASAKVKLAELKKEDLGYTQSLAAFWDTLGWVHFRMGNLDRAEKYLDAAWTLSQWSVIGDHLGQVYEQEHKKQQAVYTYQLALAAAGVSGRMPETQLRLEHLNGKTTSDRLDNSVAADLSLRRTFKLRRITPETASAEFFLVLGQGSKVEEVKFISGSDKLKSADKVLSSLNFKTPLPDDGPTRLVRRGILSCYLTSGCSFVFLTPDMVRSVN
ncbi:MAG TPA: DUF3857 domain-containing protein [Terriglobales bacterium]|nr:DUF3857 domain-containing protein [Terriglobales bacterium]